MEKPHAQTDGEDPAGNPPGDQPAPLLDLTEPADQSNTVDDISTPSGATGEFTTNEASDGETIITEGSGISDMGNLMEEESRASEGTGAITDMGDLGESEKDQDFGKAEGK